MINCKWLETHNGKHICGYIAEVYHIAAEANCSQVCENFKPKKYIGKENTMKHGIKPSREQRKFIEKCGYGLICDYCTETDKGRPCVRALNETLRETGGKIDYSKIDEEYFEDVFQGGVKE